MAFLRPSAAARGLGPQSAVLPSARLPPRKPLLPREKPVCLNIKRSCITRAQLQRTVQEHEANGATQFAAAAAAVLLLSASLPAHAATLAPTSEQQQMQQQVEQQQQQQQVAAAPSLVASPLPGEATADLTAAVAQQVVAATLPPPGDANPTGSPAADGGLAAAAAAVAGSEAAAAVAAAAVVEGKVVDGLRAVGQRANLLEGTMPAVGGAVPASWLSSTPLCSAWQAYCASLQQSPLVTKAATSIVGTFLGDLLAQYIAAYAPDPASRSSSRRNSSDGGAAAAAAAAQQQPRPRRRSASGSGGVALGNTGGFEYDAGRALRLAAFAALINTPMAHYWYIFLDAVVSPDDPTAPAAVATKVLLDQGLQTPFGMALFFACLKLFEGRPSEVVPEIRAKLMPSLIANWYVWPAAQLINFTLIPLDMRILYVNIISIGWTAYISNMASGAPVTAAAGAGAGGTDGAQGHGAAAAEVVGADGGAAAEQMPLRRAGTTVV